MARFEHHSTAFVPERAILVGVDLGRSEWLLDDSLAELGRLAQTDGAEVVGTLTQRLDAPVPKTFIGKGKIDEYILSQWKKKMQALWLEKTGTKDPVEWSEKYNTPILCMVSEEQRPIARRIFDIIKSSNPSEDDAKAAIEFMNGADFYDRLSDSSERDRLFMELIVGTNSVLLTDVNDIRSKLRAKLLQESPYYWFGSSEVQKYLKSMVDKEYKLRGSEMASQIIDRMDTAQLREYLKRRIDEDAEFGIQILKGEDGK